MWVLQAPGETAAHHIDWTDWLEPEDAIATSDWNITPSDYNSPANPELDFDDPEDIDYDDDRTTVRVSGLTLGVSYQLKNTITTEQGMTGEREITIRCDNQ